jgi:uncharacterized membrane protein
MNPPDDPRTEYLRRFGAALGRMNTPDRDELLGEIRSHIAEAEADGVSVETVIERLGSPERLARAYAASALLEGSTPRSALSNLRAAALVATTSVVSALVVPLLVVLAVGFVVSGALGLFFGIAALAISPAAVGISPPTYEGALAAIAGGVAFLGLALLAARALRGYLRFVLSTLRRAPAENAAS